MSNSTLFVNEIIHQGHERFSDISRGRQCPFEFFDLEVCSVSGSSSIDDLHSRPDPHTWRPHVP